MSSTRALLAPTAAPTAARRAVTAARASRAEKSAASAFNRHRRRLPVAPTRAAAGKDASASSSSSSPSSPEERDDGGVGEFREFPRDEQGRVLDMDGNVVVSPENNWVREMEREWAATGYDDRFFDDDWDDVKPGPKPPPKEKYPFKDIEDEEWRETGTWEDEAADGTISESEAAAGRRAAARTAATADASSSRASTDPRLDPGPGFTPPVMDLTYDEEAAMLGFDARGGGGGDEIYEEPEGPPAVLLAGFRAEEIPRVRELLDELGGHDVPVAPVPQEYLRRPLYAALQIREPDWESPRAHERFNQGGEFGSQRCVVFSGLDRGEMATVVSAIESRGLPRLITVVVTSKNVEQSLGEALATAVKESRAEAKRADEHRRKDYVAELKKLERKAAKEGLSVEVARLAWGDEEDVAAAEAWVAAARGIEPGTKGCAKAYPDVLLLADVVYGEHPDAWRGLVRTIAALAGPGTAVLLSHTRRGDVKGAQRKFFDWLKDAGFVVEAVERWKGTRDGFASLTLLYRAYRYGSTTLGRSYSVVK